MAMAKALKEKGQKGIKEFDNKKLDKQVYLLLFTMF